MRLAARRPGRTLSLAHARPEIERRLLPAKQQELLRAWLTEREANSKIEVFTERRVEPRRRADRGGVQMAIARWMMVGMALLAGSAAAADRPALTDEKDRRSYALGMAVGKQLRSQAVEVDPDLHRQGLEDALSGGKTLLTEAEARAAVQRLQVELKQPKIARQREKLRSSAAARSLQVSFQLDPRRHEGRVHGRPLGVAGDLRQRIRARGRGHHGEGARPRRGRGHGWRARPQLDRLGSRDGGDLPVAGRRGDAHGAALRRRAP